MAAPPPTIVVQADDERERVFWHALPGVLHRAARGHDAAPAQQQQRQVGVKIVEVEAAPGALGQREAGAVRWGGGVRGGGHQQRAQQEAVLHAAQGGVGRVWRKPGEHGQNEYRSKVRNWTVDQCAISLHKPQVSEASALDGRSSRQLMHGLLFIVNRVRHSNMASGSLGQ